MRRPLPAIACLLTLAVGCAHRPSDGRPWVHDLSFRGMPHIDKSELAHRLAVEKTSWLPFAPKRWLDPLALEADQERVAVYLRAHGYSSARVAPPVVLPHGHNSVDIFFDVVAGPPTRVRSLDVRGLESLGDKLPVTQGLLSQPGRVFVHPDYLADKQSLLDRARARGYGWAEVKGQVLIDRTRQTADITLDVIPGPLVRFGQVTVRGALRTDPATIERRVAIVPGAPFSPAALDEARRRLAEVARFSTVEVECQHDPAHADVCAVLVSVSEAPPNELKLSAGFGLEAQLTNVHAQLAWTRHGFLGGLRTLKLRLAPAWVATPAFWSLIGHSIARQGPGGTVEAQLTQPDRPWRRSLLSATLAYDLGIDYAYQFHGPRLQLALAQMLWRERVQLQLSYNFQSLFFFATDPAILADPKNAGQLYAYVDPYRLGYVQELVALDLRDRPLDARRGVYAAVAAEEGGAWSLGEFQYEKLQPELRGYLPLGGRVVMAARVEYGQLFTQGELGSPITRRFYLGGPDSHRGFSYDRLAPQVRSEQPRVAALPIGGDKMVLAQAELRSDLVPFGGNWLAMALFLDAGDATASNDKLDVTQLHYAAGGGLRLKTALGVLRTDLGVRLNRLTAMQPDGASNPDPGCRLAFHISFGQAF
jgi:outer membrane protein assembly factor BamA